MANKCSSCGLDVSSDKQYCYFCDPSIPAEVKKATRAKGGANSRKIPHNLNPADYLPLTIESVKRLQGDLIAEAMRLYQDDAAAMFKTVGRLLPEAEKLVIYETMTLLNDKLDQVESRRNGHRLSSGKVNDAEIIEYRQQD